MKRTPEQINDFLNRPWFGLDNEKEIKRQGNVNGEKYYIVFLAKQENDKEVIDLGFGASLIQPKVCFNIYYRWFNGKRNFNEVHHIVNDEAKAEAYYEKKIKDCENKIR